MSTADERLAHVVPKIDRAKHHVDELDRTLSGFLASQPYGVAVRRDAESRRPIYYVDRVESPPVAVALIAGDAIQNLVTALDHLAYQLVLVGSGDAPPHPSRIYFPIAGDATQYEKDKFRKLEGARPDVFTAIDRIRPYKEGNELLWVLSRLNVIEKHRLLLTVGSYAAGVNIGQFVSGHLLGTVSPATIAALQTMNLFLNPADKGFPLRPGFDLYADAPGAAFNTTAQFKFDVGLHEPGVIEHASILDTVRRMVTAVEDTIAALRPLLG